MESFTALHGCCMFSFLELAIFTRFCSTFLRHRSNVLPYTRISCHDIFRSAFLEFDQGRRSSQVQALDQVHVLFRHQDFVVDAHLVHERFGHLAVRAGFRCKENKTVKIHVQSAFICRLDRSFRSCSISLHTTKNFTFHCLSLIVRFPIFELLSLTIVPVLHRPVIPRDS